MAGSTPERGKLTLRVLGSLEVHAGGRSLPLGPRKQQLALAMLVVHAGQVVGLDELIDELWPDGPPASAVANVRSYTASIRRMFETVEDRRDRLVRRGSGYQLHADLDELDLLAFSSRVATARAAVQSGELTVASSAFLDALTYWQGPMLAGLRPGPVLAARAAVMDENRQSVVEELGAVLLALGDPDEVVRLLHQHVHLHPLRERAYALLMQALCRLGDSAGALSIYTDARNAIGERLGVEPGLALQKLYRSILDGKPELDPPVRNAIPRRPMVVHPAELPADLVDFVGRSNEIDRAIAVLNRPGTTSVPICRILGQAGVGKTTLSVHVAHRLRADYPDGQLFVDLRGADSHPLTSAEVLARFLRALGVPGQAIPHDGQERAALYRSLLADRRLLIVLDNAVDEEQVRPLLPGTATCAVLVTSRYQLAGVGSESVDLDVFGTDSALDLLDRAAGTARVRAELGAAEELVRLCGGLPLALRVVGVKLATSPHRTLSALVDRLAEERHRLDQLSHAGLAVRSSLDFSYQRIDPGDRRLLRRVALLDAPDFAAWTAAAVADLPVPVVEEGLDRLVAAHLVQTGGTDLVGQVRYRLHDLIRVYARERAEAEDTGQERLAAVRRTIHYWLALASAGEKTMFGPGYYYGWLSGISKVAPSQRVLAVASADPLRWIDAERAAFVSAVRQAAESGLFAECWRLASVSATMLAHRELRDESIAVHTLALDATRRIGDRRGEAIVLVALGRLECEGGDWARSRSLFEVAERIMAEEGDTHGLAFCYWEMAYQDRLEGKLVTAWERYTTMLQACRGTDPALEAMGLRGLGQVQLLAKSPEAALSSLTSALAVSGRGAGVMPRLLVLQWCGEAYLELGDTARAAAAFSEVVSSSDRIGAFCGLAVGLDGLARVALAEGKIDEADLLATRAQDQGDQLQEPSMGLLMSSTLARVRLARGSLTSARDLAERVLTDGRSVGATMHQAGTLELLAEIHEAAGDAEAAAAVRAELAALLPSIEPVAAAEPVGELVTAPEPVAAIQLV